MKITYAASLASAKLQSKKILLLFSILICSLLFGALICAVVVFAGAQKSANDYVSKSNGGLYRVSVNPVIPESVYNYGYPLSKESIDHLRSVEKEYYGLLKDKYTKAGLKYDAAQEVSALRPSAFASPTTPEALRFDVNYASPVVNYDFDKRLRAYAATAGNKLDGLKMVAAKYGGSGFYAEASTGSQPIPSMTLVQNGKEDLANAKRKEGASIYDVAVHAVFNGDYIIQDGALLQRYLFDHQEGKELAGIPVVPTAQEIAELFGKDLSIGKEPASYTDKLAWLKEIKEKANGYTYQACYRNSAEMQIIQKIQLDYAEAQNAKGKKDYVAPPLQYALADGPCGAVTIKTDTRTSEQKKADAQLITDQKKLGTYVEPAHRLLTFVIVGAVNAQPQSKYDADLSSFLKNLIGSSGVGFGAYVPAQSYDKVPQVAQFMKDADTGFLSSSAYVDNGLVMHVVDFPSIDAARSFMDKETCPSTTSDCKKLFTSEPYGSNYLLLQEIGKFFNKIMTYAVPAALVFSLAVIWFTLARILAESRKETAVYRAMGARRGDIASVYLMYVLMIATLIALLSSILGIGAALVIDRIYSPTFTAVASSSYGYLDQNMQFGLFSVATPYLPAVIASIFVISLVASAYPLMRNVRRSPLKDMREE